PSYDASERGYDGPTLELLKSGLEIRLENANRFRQVREYLEAHGGGFIDADRVSAVASLTALERSAPGPMLHSATDVRGSSGTADRASEPAAAPPVAVAPVDFETLSKADRQTFDEALKLEATSPRDAWTVASPFFEAHPSVRPVQELRCRLAKARKFF